MTLNKKDLGKLHPKERLEKLKEIGDLNKKEGEEIEALIKKSMHELKITKIAEDITPEQKEVDISRLFAASSNNSIEDAAQIALPSNNENGYEVLAQVYHDYSRLKTFYGIVTGGNPLSEDEIAVIGTIGERINLAERYMTEGEKISSKLGVSKVILYRLKKETGLE